MAEIDEVSSRRKQSWQAIDGFLRGNRHMRYGTDQVRDILAHLDELDDANSNQDERGSARRLSPTLRPSLLISGQNSNSWEERYAATALLGRAGRHSCDVVVDLIGRLQDTHACVRAAAATSLAVFHQAFEHGGPMLRISVHALVMVLDDDQVWVRVASRRALYVCTEIALRAGVLDHTIVQEIWEHLGNNRPPVRQAATDILSAIFKDLEPQKQAGGRMHHSALESSLATAMSKYAKAKTNFDNSRMEIERCNAENIAFHKELKMKEIKLLRVEAKMQELEERNLGNGVVVDILVDVVKSRKRFKDVHTVNGRISINDTVKGQRDVHTPVPVSLRSKLSEKPGLTNRVPIRASAGSVDVSSEFGALGGGFFLAEHAVEALGEDAGPSHMLGRDSVNKEQTNRRLAMLQQAILSSREGAAHIPCSYSQIAADKARRARQGQRQSSRGPVGLISHTLMRNPVVAQVVSVETELSSDSFEEPACSANAGELLWRAQKRAAIEALGFAALRGDQDVLDRAHGYLQDQSFGVRCAALFTIGRISEGDKKSWCALRESLLHDADPSVRAAAAWGIAALCEDGRHVSVHALESVGDLLKSLEDHECWVRLAAHRTLCTCMKAFSAASNDTTLVVGEANLGDAYESVITQVSNQLVHPCESSRDAARKALQDAGILGKSTSLRNPRNERACVFKCSELVARTLAQHARELRATRDTRGLACSTLLEFGLWSPSVLSKAELHGYLLWDSSVAVRRRAAEALCALAKDFNFKEPSKVRPTGLADPSDSSTVNGNEGVNEHAILVAMLSLGLEDSDVEVCRFSLVGLEHVIQDHDEQIVAALAEMVRTELNIDNLSRGIRLLIKSDASKARETLSGLIGHADEGVRIVAQGYMQDLKMHGGLMLDDLVNARGFSEKLGCLSRLTKLHARRGSRLLQTKLLHDCSKLGYQDGDCVLAVLNSQLCLGLSIQEMRSAAPFVSAEGVNISDEETWRLLESKFFCRIELVDVFTLRTVRQAAGDEGLLLHIALLNGHAYAISNDDVLHLKRQQTNSQPWDQGMAAAISRLLDDESPLVTHAAALALGDIACAGDSSAIDALVQAFSLQHNAGREGVIMSAICKLCSLENEDALNLMFQQLESPLTSVTLPILITIAELLTTEPESPSASWSRFVEQCARFLKDMHCETREECIRAAHRFALSRLDQLDGETRDHNHIKRKNKQEERWRREKEDKDRKERRLTEKHQLIRNKALAELQSDSHVRRAVGLDMILEIILGHDSDMDHIVAKATADVLYDDLPHLRVKAMGILRHFVKHCIDGNGKKLGQSSTPPISICIQTLLEVVRRRDVQLSTHAVTLLGEMVPLARGAFNMQEVIDFLLQQLNIQKMNYLGNGIRRNIWDRVIGFRQATLQALLQIMPSGDSKAFVTGLAIDDLDSSQAHVRDAAFEILAEHTTDATIYTIVVVKMIKMLKAKDPATRHFAILALQQISQPKDTQVLLALRNVIEDRRLDAFTHILVAQAMLQIDEENVGVHTAIRLFCPSLELDAASFLEKGKAVLDHEMQRPCLENKQNRVDEVVSKHTDPVAFQGSSQACRRHLTDRLKKTVLMAPPSLSKTGRTLDDTKRIRRMQQSSNQRQGTEKADKTAHITRGTEVEIGIHAVEIGEAITSSVH